MNVVQIFTIITNEDKKMKKLLIATIFLISMCSLAQAEEEGKWVKLSDVDKFSCHLGLSGFSIKYNGETIFHQVGRAPKRKSECIAVLNQAREEKNSIYFNFAAKVIVNDISEVLVSEDGYFIRASR